MSKYKYTEVSNRSIWTVRNVDDNLKNAFVDHCKNAGISVGRACSEALHMYLEDITRK